MQACIAGLYVCLRVPAVQVLGGPGARGCAGCAGAVCVYGGGGLGGRACAAAGGCQHLRGGPRATRPAPHAG